MFSSPPSTSTTKKGSLTGIWPLLTTTHSVYGRFLSLVSWSSMVSTHHAIQDFAEDHVFPIQPRRLGSQDEELRSVGVGTGVRHTDLNTDVGAHG
ncbi:hypothetical protein EYF80_050453 [Liparis tanakae]|uniref:Uncharacterized protein n=1 Tax=Liparis tanakae TaxID=230148 RepID=A0A4Z2FDW1_9TELE|nr:hypothetical protein EYF80_050453 [Liparis tanakae]